MINKKETILCGLLQKYKGELNEKIMVTIQSLISQNLRFYSMWRIRQITLCKDMFMNASIHHISLIKLLGSEQLQIMKNIMFII